MFQSCLILVIKKYAQDFSDQIAEAMASAYDNRESFPDIDKLLISPMHAWILFVDVTVLQMDGNVIDTISLGIKAALADTKICNIVKRPADEGKVLIDLPEECSTWTLDVSKAPLVIGVCKLGDYCMVDPTAAEEKSSATTLFVGVMPKSEDAASNNGECKVICVKNSKVERWI